IRACRPRATGFPNTQAGTDRTGRAMRASARAMTGCRLHLAPFPLARDRERLPEAKVHRISAGQSNRLREFRARCVPLIYPVAALRLAESELKPALCRDARQ